MKSEKGRKIRSEQWYYVLHLREDQENSFYSFKDNISVVIFRVTREREKKEKDKEVDSFSGQLSTNSFKIYFSRQSITCYKIKKK